jgi:hypothetical protein
VDFATGVGQANERAAARDFGVVGMRHECQNRLMFKPIRHNKDLTLNGSCHKTIRGPSPMVRKASRMAGFKPERNECRLD